MHFTGAPDDLARKVWVRQNKLWHKMSCHAILSHIMAAAGKISTFGTRGILANGYQWLKQQIGEICRGKMWITSLNWKILGGLDGIEALLTQLPPIRFYDGLWKAFLGKNWKRTLMTMIKHPTYQYDLSLQSHHISCSFVRVVRLLFE